MITKPNLKLIYKYSNVAFIKLRFKLFASVLTIALFSITTNGCGSSKEEANQANQANQPQAIPVKLKTLESVPLIDSSEYVGNLEARERVSLAPRIDGRILEILVRQGDRVSRGDKIAILEPTQAQEDVNAATQRVNVEKARLGQTEAELRTAEANRAAAAAEVESARADIQDSEAEVELAQINVERTKMLVSGGAIAQQDLDDDNRDLKSNIAQRNSRRESLNAAIESLQAAEKQVEQARANINSQQATIKQYEAELGSTSQSLAYNTITAPIDGFVGSFDQSKVGDYVSVGDQLTTITNNQNFDLNINIPTEYRSRLRRGLKVETINDDHSPGIKGEITYVAPLVQQDTQSILTKVTFPHQGSLRDREYIRVKVIWDEQPGVLIPTSAISTLGGQSFVYLAQQQESDSGETSLTAQQQPIKLGSIQSQDYQIISGVKEGDRIAVSNILSLRDGTAISEAEEKQAVSNGETEQY